ncbi:MAG: ATP-binding cassette domain-containing protein [Propionibacteriaceae bacterium]|jgi:D-methionine transport system ATP-binding protein|nr:ATP-binding cassette domain-containing protein [Propionibacteriaceae bacterium]
MISLHDLRKSYPATASSPGVEALRGVSLEVAEGEVHGIVGESGAGKSTLVRCVNLLERPTSGQVVVNGIDLTALPESRLRQARRNIGMIFQHFNLLSSRTVQGNVELALELAGLPRREHKGRSLELLEYVGLAERARSFPSQLSGGQKQRVGIARALAANPKVLLSDEATSALDPATTADILGLIRQLNRQLGLTVLLITHQMEVVRKVCDSVTLMRDGLVVEQGDLNEVLTRPDSDLSNGLFDLGPQEAGAGLALLEITFAGGNSSQHIISRLARQFDLDFSIDAAAIEVIGGVNVGRIRLEASARDVAASGTLDWLRQQGLIVRLFTPPDDPAPDRSDGGAADEGGRA